MIVPAVSATFLGIGQLHWPDTGNHDHSDEVLADFEHIIKFLLKTSLEAAMQTLMAILSAVGILEAHPLIGRRIDHHIRELVISQRATGYVALYRFDAGFESNPHSADTASTRGRLSDLILLGA